MYLSDLELGKWQKKAASIVLCVQREHLQKNNGDKNTKERIRKVKIYHGPSVGYGRQEIKNRFQK